MGTCRRIDVAGVLSLARAKSCWVCDVLSDDDGVFRHVRVHVCFARELGRSLGSQFPDWRRDGWKRVDWRQRVLVLAVRGDVFGLVSNSGTVHDWRVRRVDPNTEPDSLVQQIDRFVLDGRGDQLLVRVFVRHDSEPDCSNAEPNHVVANDVVADERVAVQIAIAKPDHVETVALAVSRAFALAEQKTNQKAHEKTDQFSVARPDVPPTLGVADSPHARADRAHVCSAQQVRRRVLSIAKLHVVCARRRTVVRVRPVAARRVLSRVLVLGVPRLVVAVRVLRARPRPQLLSRAVHADRPDEQNDRDDQDLDAVDVRLFLLAHERHVPQPRRAEHHENGRPVTARVRRVFF